MRAVLLSDVHADGPRCPRQTALLGFLEAVRPSHLVVAGDLFERGWADADGVAEPIAPLLDAIAHAPELWLTPGNHDFLLARWASGRAGVVCGPVLERTLCGHRVVVSHGDSADGTRGYRLWTAFVRGGWARRVLDGLVVLLGRTRTWRLLGGGASTRRDPAPFRTAPTELVAAQRAIAQAALARGAALVVHGHTHAPCLERLDGGVWLNLGDWVTHRTYGVVDDDGVALCAWEGAERVLVRLPLR